MNIDLKSLLIGFLFAMCIFAYMEYSAPESNSRYQAVPSEAGVIIIDTHTGEVIHRDQPPKWEPV